MKLLPQLKSVFAVIAGLVMFGMSVGAQGDARIQRHLLRAMEADATTGMLNEKTVVSHLVGEELVFKVYLSLDDLERTARPSAKASMPDLKSRARRLQDLALAGLDVELADRVIRRYSTLPVLAAELSVREIEAVAKNPYVTDISAWTQITPQWMEAQTLMGVTALAEGPQGLTGQGAVIAVIDTAFDAMHPSLGGAPFPNSKIIGGTDIGDGDDNPTFALRSGCDPSELVEHGTTVAAIAAGAEVLVDDGAGLMRGTAPDAKIVAIKYYRGLSTPDEDSQCGRLFNNGDPGDMLLALEWLAANIMSEDPEINLNIDILSISFNLGGGGDTSEFSAAECDAQWPAVNHGFRLLEDLGIIIFAAAGNRGAGIGTLNPLGKQSLGAPACLSSVISVGGTYAQEVNAPVLGGATVCTMDDTLNEFNYCASATSVAVDHVMASSSNANFLDLMAPAAFQTLARTTHFDPAAGDSESGLERRTCSLGGTSFAAPNAAGIAALMIEKVGKGVMDQTDMRRLLGSTGCCVTDNNSWPQITKPRVNALSAAQLLDGDEDSDGVLDFLDNCLSVPNPDQRDTNNDGVGNPCDPDLDNNGVVDVPDLNIIRRAFFTLPPMLNWNPDADFDGDDFVGFADMAMLADAMDQKPGPSGYTSFHGQCGLSRMGSNCPTVEPASRGVLDPGLGNQCIPNN